MSWDLNAGDLAMSLLFVAVEEEGFHLPWEHRRAGSGDLSVPGTWASAGLSQ